MRIVPSAVPEISVISKHLHLITLGQIKDHGLGKHALSTTQPEDLE